MFIFLVIIILRIIIFLPNSLNYSLSLLLISSILLLEIVVYNHLRVIIFSILIIVYSGAIMILIGYICAVCPNIFLYTSNNSFVYYIVILLAVTLFFINSNYSYFFQSFNYSSSLVDFFYTFWGVWIFLIIIFIIFLTLLIVTSQYSSPKGPLRSTS